MESMKEGNTVYKAGRSSRTSSRSVYMRSEIQLLATNRELCSTVYFAE